VLPASEPGFPDRGAAFLHFRRQPQPLSGTHHRPGLPGRAVAGNQVEVTGRLRGLVVRERVMRRRIVAGNWKLHGDRAFAHALMDAIAAEPAPEGVERVVLPPLPYLAHLVDGYAGKGIAPGSQDVSVNEQDAYTGEASAAMLADLCARYGPVRHS